MKLIEGVSYYRFAIEFRTLVGKRFRWMRWSPGNPWLQSEIERELEERGFYPENLKRGGYSVRRAP